MAMSFLRKPLMLSGAFFLLWLGVKYVFPVLLPFLAGLFLALGAEPLVRFAQTRFRLNRVMASGLGVTVTLLLLAAILTLTGALLVKELTALASALPDLGQTARLGMQQLQHWLTDMAHSAPAGLRPVLNRSVDNFFSNSDALMSQITQRLPGLLTAALGWVPGSVLGVGTAILSGYMISGRLVQLRQRLTALLPADWKEKGLPFLQKLRHALGLWLLAQSKLALVTFGIVTTGFLLLRIPYAPAWAGVVALIDAVPVLGTGTILVPWSIVCLLQGNHLRAIGLLGIFGTTLITRSTLEPRIVGRHLGIDPLLTLLALYLGYRFWGIVGMILAPILATAAKAITDSANP